jgi:hypothetical protein
MAAKPRVDREQDTNPIRFPETTPAHTRDDSFTLQAVMEMQKTLGKLDHAVTLLVASEADTKAKIGRIEKVFYAAGVVLLICLSLGGWMLTAAKDFAMTYYKASLEAQKPLVIIPQTAQPQQANPPIASPQVAPVK